MQEVIDIKEDLNNFFLLLIHMKLISFTHVFSSYRIFKSVIRMVEVKPFG